MIVDNIKEDCEFAPVSFCDEVAEVFRRAISALDREEEARIVTPGAVHPVFLHR